MEDKFDNKLQELSRSYVEAVQKEATDNPDYFGQSEDGVRVLEDQKTRIIDTAKEIELNKLTFNDMIRLDRVMTEAMTTSHVSVLINRVIAGTLRMAQEPNYVISNLFTQVRLSPAQAAQVVEYPIVGPLRASFLGEGQAYPLTEPDFIRARTMAIRVQKAGIALKFTREMVADSLWDVMSVVVKLAGLALARLREEWCTDEMLASGITIFDNTSSNATFLTSGRDRLGDFNETMSIDDYIQLMASMYMNDFTPTHVLMNPLVYLSFIQTNIHGGLTGIPVTPGTGVLSGLTSEGGNNGGMVSSQVPFLPSFMFSHFIPLNKHTKVTDVFCVDANNLGIIAIREPVTSDTVQLQMNDASAILMRERYGVGILHQGRGIVMAKNVAVAPSFPFKVQLTRAYVGSAERS